MPHPAGRKQLRQGFAAALLCGLTACGGGGGGGDTVTLASGDQDEDPVVLEIPIAYVRRPVPDEAPDKRNPLAFNPGAELFLRNYASPSADETNVTDQMVEIVAEELGVDGEALLVDIKDLSSSYDGSTLLFAARLVPEPVADNLDNTTWNLWQFDLESMQASYVIPSRIKRNEGVEAGSSQDIAPQFLPDDRILFSSTRQSASQARHLDEDRIQLFAALDEAGNQPAAVLHIYDPQRRGEELHQISFNRSHDLDPTVLANGEIVFSRWENSIGNHISLFRVRPSGKGLSPLYGFHSQNSGTDGARVIFTQPTELEDGRLAALTHGFSPDSLGGEIVLVDTENFADFTQPLWQSAGAGGNGHEPLTETEVRSDNAVSPGGQYGGLYPLHDGSGRMLVTWSECRVVDEEADLQPGEEPEAGDLQPCKLRPDNTDPAPPLYGAWVYDPGANTQRPVVLAREGFQVSDVVALESRDYPEVLPRVEGDNSDLAVRGLGQLRISSVYDMDGVDSSPAGIANHARPGTPMFDQRPARFLRILQAVPIPDEDIFEIPRYAYGISTAFGFREIMGYVPVEPDGSVSANLPAQRALRFDILDQRGRRIGDSHDYWLQLAPGEVLNCTGCHDHGSGLPHGRTDTAPISANPGARALNTGTLGFPATDSAQLFASFSGQSMAEVWDDHRPVENPAAPAHDLTAAPRYSDEWSGPGVTPEDEILDRDYDPAWLDIPAERALIVSSFDGTEAGRIVINYPDHIQPIWERSRTPVADAEGTEFDSCIACHTSNDDTQVPAGQLDLSALPSDLEPEHYRSYHELLSGDAELWLDASGAISDRQRTCINTDDEGNQTTTVVNVPVASTAVVGSANRSEGFFRCFEGGVCGPADAPPLPANCTEDAGEPTPATRNSVNHVGLLSESELHLISEWLDIGGQYFNNPFDSRLVEQ